MLELPDIQGPSVSGYKLPLATFVFLRIPGRAEGREWIRNIVDDITTGEVRAELPPSCVNVGFTFTGLQQLGLAQASLDTFADEFRQGIAQRATVLGDTGDSSPSKWDGGLGTGDMHAMLLIFAKHDQALREQLTRQRAAYERAGVTKLSSLDARALPEQREHFGYRDGITHVLLEGSGRPALPGQTPVKPGEFIFGYEDESGVVPPFPQPSLLGRNGSYYVYRRLYQDVPAWRRFIAEGAPAIGLEPELLAAKLMGRWRSGAPIVLAPKEDDGALGSDPMRNGDFGYKDDPKGFACPMGAHIRRANPREDIPERERKRHLLMRRGLPYGKMLPDGVSDDGEDRGVAGVFVNASISRQFEFVQDKWFNDRKFNGLENEKDPLAGDHEGTCVMTIPAKPFRKKTGCLSRFTRVKGGAYLFAPGISALRALGEGATV
jgi:Dyp-type peroxidase family